MGTYRRSREDELVPPPPADTVYVTRRGKVFHTAPCQIVERTWQYGRDSLAIIERKETGKRRLCASCAGQTASAGPAHIQV